MKKDNYIVSIKPLDPRSRARDTLLTLVMWGVYIYLWIPLITLGAWLVGFDRFYEVMINYGGFEVVMSLLDWYALMILFIAVCIVSWSGINYRRFHDKERRYSALGTETRKISEFFGVSETEFERIQSSRRLVIDLDEIGCISNVTHGGYSGVEELTNP